MPWVKFRLSNSRSSVAQLGVYLLAVLLFTISLPTLTAFPHTAVPLIALVTVLLSLLLALIFVLRRPTGKFYFSPLTPIIFFILVWLSLLAVAKFGVIPLEFLFDFPGTIIMFCLLVFTTSALVNVVNTRIIINFFLFLGLGSAIFAIIALFGLFSDWAPLIWLQQYYTPDLALNLIVLALASVAILFFKKGKLKTTHLLGCLPLLTIGLVATITLIQTPMTNKSNFTHTLAITHQQIYPASSLSWKMLLLGSDGTYATIAQRHLEPSAITNAPQQAWSTPFTLLLVAGLPALLAFLSLIIACLILSFQKNNPQHHFYFLACLSFLTSCFTAYYPLLAILQALLLAIAIPKTRPALAHQPFWAFWRVYHFVPRRVGNLCLAGILVLMFAGGSWLFTQNFLGYHYYQQLPAAAADLATFAQSARQATQVAPFIDDFARLAAVAHLELMMNDLTEETEVTPDNFYQAVDYAEKAIALNPYDAVNYTTLASLYQEISPYLDEASRPLNDQQIPLALAQAIMLQPQNSELYLQLADYYYSLHQWDETINLYQKALVYQPQSLVATFHLGLTYQQLGQVENARSTFIDALNLLDPQAQDYQDNYELINSHLQTTTPS